MSPFDLKYPKNPASGKEAALKAARERSAAPTNAIQKWIDPDKAKDRLRLVFDDSGSMSGKPVEQARAGSIEFLRNCVPNQTAVAIHCLSTKSELSSLSSNLMEIAAKLKDLRFNMGGTPLFSTMREALIAEPKLTRMVVFTDGSPTDSLLPYDESRESKHPHNRYLDDADIIIAQALELKAPIDTIYFGSVESYTQTERELLEYLAKGTGGFYMVFDPQKVNFRTAFKYLAPTNRLMLASESVRKEIESGKRT